MGNLSYLQLNLFTNIEEIYKIYTVFSQDCILSIRVDFDPSNITLSVFNFLSLLKWGTFGSTNKIDLNEKTRQKSTKSQLNLILIFK